MGCYLCGMCGALNGPKHCRWIEIKATENIAGDVFKSAAFVHHDLQTERCFHCFSQSDGICTVFSGCETHREHRENCAQSLSRGASIMAC